MLVRFFQGKSLQKINFDNRGFVYGVIRISTKPGAPEYEQIVKTIMADSFIEDKVAVFLVRDPRDILISQYYSFGYSHSYSPVPQIRQSQAETRAKIQSKTLDEYVIEAAPGLKKKFTVLKNLSLKCKRGTILKYEDMILNFDRFMEQLSQFLQINEEVRQELFQRSRPRKVEKISKHKRSGKVGDYTTKLKDETISTLNSILAPTLTDFGYPI